MGGNCPRDSGQSRARDHWSAAESTCARRQPLRMADRGTAETVESEWEVSITTKRRQFPSPAPGLDACSSRVSSAFRLNSARTATAAASAALGREPSANMAGTAEAASGTTTASVRLKAPRSLRGVFGIVSSASDRAAAEGKTD